MLTLIIGSISLIIILAVIIIIFIQLSSIQNDYNSKFKNIVKQVNETIIYEYEYDKQLKSNIDNNESVIPKQLCINKTCLKESDLKNMLSSIKKSQLCIGKTCLKESDLKHIINPNELCLGSACINQEKLQNILNLEINNNLIMYLDATNPSSYNGSGNIWHDLSGNGNSLTLYNCGSIINKAITFNGSSSYGYISNLGGKFNSSNFSLVFWVHVKAGFSTPGNTLCTYGRSPSSANNELAFYTNWFWDYSNGYDFSGKPNTLVADAGWYQIVFVKNNTNGVFYLNGAPNGTIVSGSSAVYGDHDFCIGKDFRDNIMFLNGDIGVVMIYNYSMTPSDVNMNFHYFKTRYDI